MFCVFASQKLSLERATSDSISDRENEGGVSFLFVLHRYVVI